MAGTATSATGSALPRLHLGCGERYLDGYVNIDYPSSEHTVQQTSPADELADITRLRYEPESVAEVRLHHVFEHFDRPTALRLLIDWHEWLVDGGRLVIETPDFERSARAFSRRIGRRDRGTLVRHMFGSHEAAWAVHWDGWYPQRYRRVLGALGYGSLKFDRQRWRDTYNVTVDARREGGRRDREAQLAAADEILRESLVDDSETELRLLAEWSARLRTTPS
jgi:predicted SAM-dependent methyltransferase